MNKLVLFDVDKTLIKSSKAHIRAFSEAFKRIYGVSTHINIVNYHGMTDQQIILEVLKKNGLDEKTIESKLQKCMNAIIDSFNRLIDSDKITRLDGVPELLEKLRKHNVLMGLVTGSLEPIAFSKLNKAGLDGYFRIGGFGNENINRTNLVRLAIEKAKKEFNFEINDNVFLVGDTPRDIVAGREAGIQSIGVTTGIYSRVQLEEAGADFVLENLKDANRVLRIIL